MKRATPKLASGQVEGSGDQAAMTAALDRLYGAASGQIGDIVANLSEADRAKVAVFCYGRAHLNAIGLSVAAHCGLDHLMNASGSPVAGRMIYSQSRNLPAAAVKTYSSRRSVTLASSVSESFASRITAVPDAEPDLLTA